MPFLLMSILDTQVTKVSAKSIVFVEEYVTRALHHRSMTLINSVDGGY